MADISKILKLITVFIAVYVVETNAVGKVVDLSCNFDINLCSWYQDENNDFNWTISSGGNDSSTSGRPKDQTIDADHYIFIKSDGIHDNQTANLVSETQPPGNYCMTFWYKLYGNDAEALQVFLLYNETSGQTRLWRRRKNGTLSDVWLEAKLSIESLRYFKLKVSGTVSGSLDGYIAVNRILFNSVWCSPDCDFENGWCGWAGDSGSNEINWKRSSEFSDHTSKYGYYAKAYSLLYNKTSTFAMVNPRVYSGAYCLSFWYRLYHADGLFKIYLTYRSTGRVQPITEEKLKPNVDRWTLFQDDVISQESFEIAIEVTFNNHSVIHIDDIHLSCGLCGQGWEHVDCTFENGICDWKIDFVWRRTTADAESENTSPTFDHTMQSKDGHYAYMDKNGTIAVMKSPEVLPGVYCFSFWYFMNDGGSVKLQVLLNERGLDQTPKLFSNSENQGDEWRHVEIQINSTHNFSLVLVGTRENNSGGGIAVDDIHICSDQCKTDTFPRTTATYEYNPTSSVLNTEPTTRSSKESENGLVVAIAVATSCVAAIILAIFFLIKCWKTYGARMKQDLNGNSDCDEESTAVENKTYAMTNIIRCEDRSSAVNDHLQRTKANSAYDVQNDSSDYNYINLNTVPMKDKVAYVHPKVTKHSDKDKLDYSHLQCSEQKYSTEHDKTHDQTNGINSTSMMTEDDDPAYDHTVMKINTVKSCTENEYSHLERTTQEKDSYMQAVAGRKALGEKTQSEMSDKEKDTTHFTLEKQDGQTDIETLPGESHEYFLQEKIELQQK